jgi:hypothetical protein
MFTIHDARASVRRMLAARPKCDNEIGPLPTRHDERTTRSHGKTSADSHETARSSGNLNPLKPPPDGAKKIAAAFGAKAKAATDNPD